MPNPDNITADYVRSRLAFDAATGIFTWRARPKTNVHVHRWNMRFAGTQAGTPHNKGYVLIKVDGRRVLAHRLAWLYTHGKWPARDIDHVNGCPSDNRLVNLRAATDSENLANAKKRSDNTCGFKGVGFCRSKKKFRARIRIDGRQRNLGYFDNAEEAHEAYRKAAVATFGEFARFA